MGKQNDKNQVEEESDGQTRLINACPYCKKDVDITDCEPFAKIQCPHCEDFLRVRRHLAQFEILEELGVGGMSKVFRARDEELDREVALKVLSRECSADKSRVNAFKREAQLTAAVNHPNVVKVFSFGEDTGHLFISMELIDGQSMEKFIEDGEKFTFEEAIEVFSEIAEGLSSAYQSGLIHRDIKPGNILFAVEDDIKTKKKPKIVDYGLALIEGQHDEHTELWATPYHVPPEKLLGGKEDLRSDIYSLGSTMVHALSGKPPFKTDTNSIEELIKIKKSPLNLRRKLPKISRNFEMILKKMLEPEPAYRFNSYEKLLENFSRLQKKRTTKSEKKTSNKLYAIGSAILLLVLISGIYLFFKSEKNSKRKISRSAVLSDELLIVDGSSTAEKFLKARVQLIEGKAIEAGEEFSLIEQDLETIQPTLNWARYNAIICYLLENKPIKVAKLNKNLQKDANYSQENEHNNLANFFNEIANILANSQQEIQLENLAKKINDDDLFGSALLIIGLKKWQEGKINLTTKLFNKFEEMKYSVDYNWLNKYKNISKNYLHDSKIIKNLPPAPDITKKDLIEAYKLEKIRQWVLEIEKYLLNTKTKGQAEKIIRKRKEDFLPLLEKLEKLNQEKIALEKKKTRIAERKMIEKTIKKIESGQIFFDEEKAIAKLKKEKFKSPEIKKYQQAQINFWQKSIDFEKNLLSDLEQPENQLISQQLLGLSGNTQVLKMKGENIKVPNPSGSGGFVNIDIRKIAPKIKIEIAKKIIKKNKKKRIEQLENLVAFSFLNGQKEIAQKNARKLASYSPEFAEIWRKILARWLFAE